MSRAAQRCRRRGIIRELQGLLGEGGVLSGEAAHRFEEGYRYGAGEALCVVRPATTAQVADVVRHGARHGIRIIPQGANTGLVGAGVPSPAGDEIVLTTERLDRIERLDRLDRVAVAQAGVRLSALNAHAADAGLVLPIDLGADPSIGGMAATNTGGARQIKYGDMRRRVLGLEAVLASGEIFTDLGSLRKDNTGLDLKQLFIGAGGALGVVTRVAVELAPVIGDTAAALVVPSCLDAIPQLVVEAEMVFGESLVAFEGMSAAAMRAAIVHNPQVHNPFGLAPLPDYAVLIEVGARRASPDLEDRLASFLQVQAEGDAPLISDARFGPAHRFWAIRHSISEGLRAKGRVLGLDLSVGRGALPELRRRAADLLDARFANLELHDFGHWGDGGVHLNLVCPFETDDADFLSTCAQVREAIYDLVVGEFAGSFSAEHGLGPSNLSYFRRFTPEAEQRLSDGIKRLLDPACVFGTTFLRSMSDEIR